MKNDNKNFHWIEIFIWGLLGCAISYWLYGDVLFNNDVSSAYYNQTWILFIAICCIPFISKVLFDKYPLALIRSYITPSKTEEVPEKEPEEYINHLNFLDICDQHIRKYDKIADKLQNKSLDYASVGYILAMLGIFVFMFLSDQLKTTNNSFDPKIFEGNSISSYILYMITINLPRFGVLFFIEYIAIFFLKQYRVLLEEYKYYQLLKHNLVQCKIILSFFNQYKDSPDIIKLLLEYVNSNFLKAPSFSSCDKIKLEQIVNNDLDMLSKITDLIKAVNPKKNI